jgi:Domain of unknown function (DUF4032)/Lipopolysaccharide kinase (Kdo/WaaP) family
METPTLQIRPGNPDFLDLPWDEPLNDWDHARLVTMPTGIHRHPVRFVAYDEGIYVIKELSRRSAESEYRVLRALEDKSHRTAEPAGLAGREWLDPRDEGAGVLITRYVDHAFPYRRLVSGASFGARRKHMADALAGLFVELHMAGCYWGDCSLSNVLYRFDAGQIEAIMIDGETSELHPSLSDGQRMQDIEIMQENVAGEMSDVAAEMGEDLESADLDLGLEIAERYEALWSELTAELLITRNDVYRIRERIARINELGFSVEDIDITPTGNGSLVRMITNLGGRTYNSDTLRERTGIDASENQARLILSDLNYHLAKQGDITSTGKRVGTFKWLSQYYEPLIASISRQWPGADPIQGYCDYLNHRIELATSRQTDIDSFEAYDDWVRSGFPGFDPEKT